MSAWACLDTDGGPLPRQRAGGVHVITTNLSVRDPMLTHVAAVRERACRGVFPVQRLSVCLRGQTS
jgi:hypothetical protein